MAPIDDHNDAFVTIRTFANEAEAKIAKSALEAFDIECLLTSDDCGGQRPSLTFSEGIKLFVRSEDTEKAEDVLATPADPASDALT